MLTETERLILDELDEHPGLTAGEVRGMLERELADTSIVPSIIEDLKKEGLLDTDQESRDKFGRPELFITEKGKDELEG